MNYAFLYPFCRLNQLLNARLAALFSHKNKYLLRSLLMPLRNGTNLQTTPVISISDLSIYSFEAYTPWSIPSVFFTYKTSAVISIIP